MKIMIDQNEAYDAIKEYIAKKTNLNITNIGNPDWFEDDDQNSVDFPQQIYVDVFDKDEK